ncbi:DUF4176 domain-containing protein [Streptococcus suis]|uniref:Uncharacterized protein conserved in bacteria n=1 Tax=Streptococcus suis TaxID=1307 RepID=A0A123TF27_STRSU|nr:DUF4176 domain-containing protein [Streptococcus suis]MBM7281823.1 DUF4176 domain-containing protein [Streptococcus suis]MBO4116577.1 DUF4176 domain-containing protein [Streptococcus suis]MBO4118006.1 DUF4176 domain-containing protein [Streptococcus suis]MBO4125032.1 DUF4176 domain-containing protein [Streptococcus suis]MBO4129353.1 DUF4176 domain-containing protein [Streptococcus suis]
MNKSKELLPLGSVVYLEEGTQKLVIVGRGIIFNDPDSGEQALADYMGVLYPSGFQTDSTLFFQHENVDKVVFKGYSDDEESRFMEIYGQWESDLQIPRKQVK